MAVMTSCVLLCFGGAGCSTIQSEADVQAADGADVAVPRLGWAIVATLAVVLAAFWETPYGWMLLLLLVAAALGAAWAKKKVEQQRSEKDLYAAASAAGSTTSPASGSWAAASDSPTRRASRRSSRVRPRRSRGCA